MLLAFTKDIIVKLQLFILKIFGSNFEDLWLVKYLS